MIHQVYWEKFLLDFNFFISYISDRKNQKVNSLTYYSNDLSSGENNDYQQY